MRKHVLAGSLCLLTAALAGALGAAAGGAASAQPPSAAAHRLVANLENAPTSAARYRAVLAMMKALRVPVFDAAGHAVLPGGGGFQQGFNLYDFQLRGAAETLANEISLGDLAAALSVGRRVDAGKLDGALTSGVAAAKAKPSSPSSLLPLVVRELGLRQTRPVDLAAKPRAAAVLLDPLQVLLLAVDAAEHKPVSSPRRLAVTTGTAEFGCYVSPGSPDPGPSLTDQSWQGENAVATDAAALKLLPGPSPATKTHYGPPGHADLAGKPVRLGVHVQIFQRFPAEIACGPFRNNVKTGRPPQPVGNLPVSWMYGDEVLPKYLNVVHLDGATDANGEARAVLQPNNEKVPGFGQVVSTAGIVVATVSLPAVFADSVVAKKRLRVSVGQIVTVERHKPRGFKFQTSLTFTKTVPNAGAVTFVSEFDGQICGDDPFARAGWTLTQSGTETNPVSGSTTIPPQTVAGVPWPEGGTLTLGPTTFQLDIAPGPAISVKRTSTVQTFDQPTMTGTFPVVEDRSCPESP